MSQKVRPLTNSDINSESGCQKIKNKGFNCIEANAFINAANITCLDLKSNIFTIIKSNTFSNMLNLKKLELNDCKIETIEENAFLNLNSLEELDLDFNLIKTVKLNSFSNLKNIKKLILSNNQIETIEKNAFCNLDNVEEIILSDNKLFSIEEGVFHNLSSLENLYLNNNELTVINKNAFYNLPRLYFVDFENNKLSTISLLSFENVPNLTEVYLKFNMFEYDSDTPNSLTEADILTHVNSMYAYQNDYIIFVISEYLYTKVSVVKNIINKIALINPALLEYNIDSTLKQNKCIVITKFIFNVFLDIYNELETSVYLIQYLKVCPLLLYDIYREYNSCINVNMLSKLAKYDVFSDYNIFTKEENLKITLLNNVKYSFNSLFVDNIIENIIDYLNKASINFQIDEITYMINMIKLINHKLFDKKFPNVLDMERNNEQKMADIMLHFILTVLLPLRNNLDDVKPLCAFVELCPIILDQLYKIFRKTINIDEILDTLYYKDFLYFYKWAKNKHIYVKLDSSNLFDYFKYVLSFSNEIANILGAVLNKDNAIIDDIMTQITSISPFNFNKIIPNILNMDSTVKEQKYHILSYFISDLLLPLNNKMYTIQTLVPFVKVCPSIINYIETEFNDKIKFLTLINICLSEENTYIEDLIENKGLIFTNGTFIIGDCSICLRDNVKLNMFSLSCIHRLCNICNFKNKYIYYVNTCPECRNEIDDGS